MQDELVQWARRAMQALQGIASHPVNLDFARAAGAPMASRQLAQAWLVFQTAVSRGSTTADGFQTSAQAAETSTPGGATNGATAAGLNGSKTAELVLPEASTASKQAELSDGGEDEEVLAPFACSVMSKLDELALPPVKSL